MFVSLHSQLITIYMKCAQKLSFCYQTKNSHIIENITQMSKCRVCFAKHLILYKYLTSLFMFLNHIRSELFSCFCYIIKKCDRLLPFILIAAISWFTFKQ